MKPQDHIHPNSIAALLAEKLADYEDANSNNDGAYSSFVENAPPALSAAQQQQLSTNPRNQTGLTSYQLSMVQRNNQMFKNQGPDYTQPNPVPQPASPVPLHAASNLTANEQMLLPAGSEAQRKKKLNLMLAQMRGEAPVQVADMMVQGSQREIGSTESSLNAAENAAMQQANEAERRRAEAGRAQHMAPTQNTTQAQANQQALNELIRRSNTSTTTDNPAK